MSEQKFSINSEESIQEYALRKQLIAKDEQLTQANQRIAEANKLLVSALVNLSNRNFATTETLINQARQALQPKDEAELERLRGEG